MRAANESGRGTRPATHGRTNCAGARAGFLRLHETFCGLIRYRANRVDGPGMLQVESTQAGAAPTARVRERPLGVEHKQPTLRTQTKPGFAVVVACYNEQDAVLETIAELRASLRTAGPYELIIVNDGSSDGTGELLTRAAATDPLLKVVHHRRNRGYGASLKSGIRQATAPLIVITDADGTYPNHRIPELLALAAENDMVVGARTSDDVVYPLLRRIPKAFLRLYTSWIAGQPIPDFNSGLRVFRRDLAEKFMHILPDGFSFTTTITLAMLTTHRRVQFVPISYAPRIGKSKIRPIRDTLLFVQLIARTGMYFAPLRVFFPIGLALFATFLVSLAYDVIVLRNLTEKTLMLLLFAVNTAMFALLADMIDKRTAN